MTQNEFNEQITELVAQLTKKIKDLQEQVNKHEKTIAELIYK